MVEKPKGVRFDERSAGAKPGMSMNIMPICKSLSRSNFI
jgi:hypothetical protein